jgi:hypothetical protein
MSTGIQFFGDIKLEDGRTIKEHNMDLKHNIPLGTLVEIVAPDSDYETEEYMRNGLRLFVVRHDRDCDGTPLYSLSFTKTAGKEYASSVERIRDLQKPQPAVDVGQSKEAAMQVIQREQTLAIALWNLHRLEGSILHGMPEDALQVVGK